MTHMYRTLKYSKETQAKLVAWYDLEFLQQRQHERKLTLRAM